ncbi:L-fuconolactonase [Pullulanibacillus pueri]|uniref:Amidohydrolase n=1 Tax=Pullulanibacillus pueri TaxID=1437324 RepID=A0A8J2ZVH4_9BACL|nr:amidohydrolase family protein [Pullulanibacillus pueri]MBM7680925.1 L-fuconolactonase [Pullulanibacillus pueri]GGH81358.1 amidohydrolase [Pullulanibacillus pueri]
MKIDAHQHYWRISRGDYGWITPDNYLLYRDYLPGDLVPDLQKQHIDGTILVQAAPTLEETSFLLSLSERNDSILGVVGWLDLTDPEYMHHLENFSQYPKFVGFRLMIQDMPDPKRVLQPDYIKALSFFVEKDVPVDLLVTSDQLPILIQLLDRVPGLRGVVDHLAKPPIASGALQPWQEQIEAIATHSNIYCKLSGMVTEADRENWEINNFVPYVRHIIATFGFSRIMYGSDWPVCLQAASYAEVYNLVSHCLPTNVTPTQQAAFFGGNAQNFYKLKG